MRFHLRPAWISAFLVGAVLGFLIWTLLGAYHPLDYAGVVGYVFASPVVLLLIIVTILLARRASGPEPLLCLYAGVLVPWVVASAYNATLHASFDAAVRQYASATIAKPDREHTVVLLPKELRSDASLNQLIQRLAVDRAMTVVIERVGGGYSAYKAESGATCRAIENLGSAIEFARERIYDRCIVERNADLPPTALRLRYEKPPSGVLARADRVVEVLERENGREHLLTRQVWWSAQVNNLLTSFEWPKTVADLPFPRLLWATLGGSARTGAPATPTIDMATVVDLAMAGVKHPEAGVRERALELLKLSYSETARSSPEPDTVFAEAMALMSSLRSSGPTDVRSWIATSWFYALPSRLRQDLARELTSEAFDDWQRADKEHIWSQPTYSKNEYPSTIRSKARSWFLAAPTARQAKFAFVVLQHGSDNARDDAYESLFSLPGDVYTDRLKDILDRNDVSTARTRALSPEIIGRLLKRGEDIPEDKLCFYLEQIERVLTSQARRDGNVKPGSHARGEPNEFGSVPPELAPSFRGRAEALATTRLAGIKKQQYCLEKLTEQFRRHDNGGQL